MPGEEDISCLQRYEEVCGRNFDRMQQAIDRLSCALEGNGKAGLKTIVAKHELMYEMNTKMLQEHLNLTRQQMRQQATVVSGQLKQFTDLVHGPDGLIIEIDRVKRIQARYARITWIIVGAVISVGARLLFL